MRIHFRTYCYGCRTGARWHAPCVWQRHRWSWEYYIEHDGVRLRQRGPFETFPRAWASAQRSWALLATTIPPAASELQLRKRRR